MIAESVKQWFEKCPLLKNGTINVNYLGHKPIAYCIEAVPSSPIVRQYVDGGSVRRYVFVFASRDFYTENELKNMDTARFWEGLADWIECEKSLPELTEGEARKVEILSSGYAYTLVTSSEQTEGNGIYLIPIAYVNADGSITDLRSFARGRVPALASAKWNTLREIEFTVDTSNLSGYNYGYVEVEHEIDGDMNFMLFKSSTVMSVMEITNNTAEYSYIYRGNSSNSGRGDEFFCVGYSSGHGLYQATYVKSSTGYVTLRYYFPNRPSNSGTEECKYTYKALVGIIAGEK